MNRRALLQSVFSAWPLSRLHLQSPARQRYAVPPTLWYENNAGEKWMPTEEFMRTMDGLPEGFIYQHSQFPRELRHCICTDEGTLCSGGSTWPESLVLAMATSGDYTLSEAILIAANLCERCMNVAAHDYGLDWGYAHGSPDWMRANTRCEHCEGPRL